jgi:hypothetical protein
VPSRALSPLATRARLVSHVSASCAQLPRSISDYARINPYAFARGLIARLSAIADGYVGALAIRASRFVPAGQSWHCYRAMRRSLLIGPAVVRTGA